MDYPIEINTFLTLSDVDMIDNFRKYIIFNGYVDEFELKDLFLLYHSDIAISPRFNKKKFTELCEGLSKFEDLDIMMIFQNKEINLGIYKDHFGIKILDHLRAEQVEKLFEIFKDPFILSDITILRFIEDIELIYILINKYGKDYLLNKIDELLPGMEVNSIINLHMVDLIDKNILEFSLTNKDIPDSETAIRLLNIFDRDKKFADKHLDKFEDEILNYLSNMRKKSARRF